MQDLQYSLILRNSSENERIPLYMILHLAPEFFDARCALKMQNLSILLLSCLVFT